MYDRSAAGAGTCRPPTGMDRRGVGGGPGRHRGRAAGKVSYRTHMEA